EKQLNDKQLNMVFESCWTNLENALQIVPKAASSAPARRSLESMVEESLQILRTLRRERGEEMTEERRANLIKLLSQRDISSLSETARIAEFLTLGEALKKVMKSEDKSE